MRLEKHKTSRRASFGAVRLSFIDHLGIWLSRRSVIKVIRLRSNLPILESGCGYSARNVIKIGLLS